MKFFYIEDNPTNLFLVKKLLEKENIKFFSADTGEKGLNKIYKIKPDIILIDINLPGLSGYEIAKEIRKNKNLKNTTLIAISGNSSKEDKKIAYAVGFNAYIEKPINPKNFYKQILYYYHNKIDLSNFTDKEYYLDKYTDKLIDSLKDKINKLEESNIMLKKIDKIKSDFISVASHELKTPIVPITGYLEILLKEKYGKLNTKQKDILTQINDSAYRLSNIINKIIDMAKLEKGFVKLNIKPTDIIKLINKVIINLEPYTEKRKITIVKKFDNKTLIINCDEEKIEFVLYNLINNAIKFSQDNNNIYVTLQEEDNDITICIIDNGIGLKSSEINLVFEKFFSGSDIDYHHTSNYEFNGKGIGLGLSISKDFIKMHNGSLSADSKGKNKGCSFCFTIPKNTRN